MTNNDLINLNCANRMKNTLLIIIQLLYIQLSGQQLPDIKNVIVVLADDHALKVTGAYGNRTIKTPNIDRLSQQGISFNRAYCNAPICSASRQSLLTGKYPHATGVNLLFTPFPDKTNETIAEHLKKFEYKTALIGKTHWNNWMWGSLYKDGLPNHGFDKIVERTEYQEFLRKSPPPQLPQDLKFYSREQLSKDNVAEWMNYRVLPHPIDDAHSSGTFFANQAVEFIEQNHDNPFFLWLAFFEPHQPYYFPIEYTGKYQPDEMILSTGSPEDDRWIPLQYKNLSDDEKKGIIASYYTSTSYMDKNLGIVLDGLEKSGLSDNTLVIYISDNGYLLYEHKRFEKHTMWEESIRQPMIFKIGDSYRANTMVDALVEYVDIVPTILDLLAVNSLQEAQGTSFRQTLLTSAEHKELAFSEYLHDNMAMVCNKEWKYVFTTGSRDLGIDYQTGFGPSGIVHRLYDLENDPLEFRNVAQIPENAKILKSMQLQMLKKFEQTHPDAMNCPEDLTLEGKLVWYCEPRDIGFDQLQEAYPTRVFKQE